MIIFRYLLRQIFGTTVALTFILLLVILSGRFIKYLASVAAGDMSADILMQVMFYRLPGFLELILPLAFFLSILLTFGRMYMDSEMTVLQAGGYSQQRLMGYTLVLAGMIALITALISCFITPSGLYRFHQLWDDPNNFRGLNTLVEGKFQSNEGTRWVSYTSDLSSDRSQLGLVFMAHPKDENMKRETLMIAEKGHVLEEEIGRFVELDRGYRYEGNPGDANYQVTQFDRYGQLINLRYSSDQVQKEPDSLPTQLLWQSDDPKYRAIVHWRIGLPIALLIMSIVAFSLSKTNQRSGRFYKLLPALVLYLVYVFLMSAGKDSLAKGKIAESLGLWWLHAIFLIIAIALYASSQGFPFWQRLSKNSRG